MASSTPLQQLSRDELLARLEAELASIGRMKRARDLAPEIMLQLGIFPAGVDWIVWLRDVGCRSNAEAVTDWIERQLEDPAFAEEASQTSEFELLVRRLRSKLVTVKASFAC
ncbi:hypothetical protein [Hydrocarboniphaga effusa]|uniref:hypothetical protein n=1 Tax=Hydrocarboniphaga effusa TaxID=243629 RepID=UPI003BAA04B2